MRVKLLRLLYRQHPTLFSMSELATRIQEPAFIARREIELLKSIGLIKRTRVSSSTIRERDRFGLNPEFDLFNELRELLLRPASTETDRLIKRVNALGRVKMAVVAGIFVSQPDDTTYETPVDLFIVVDDLEKQKLNKLLKALEAETGTEIRCSVMERDEFRYRYEMFDRFLRVLLEGPHRKIIDKLDIEKQSSPNR